MTPLPDWQQTLQQRTKGVEGYCYKLAGDQFGMDVAMSTQVDMDESRMSVWIPFADGNRRDGVGDLLEVGGIRTERHQQNPIILFDHGKNYALPVGLAEDRDTKAYTVVLDPVTMTARANAFFYEGKGMSGIERGAEYDHALFCEQLYHLMAQRFVRAGSIGYQVIKALEIPADYQQGKPKGLHLLVTLMLEASAVVLPANQDTVRKALSLHRVCGKRMSPYLVKSLTPYAGPKKAQMGYEGKGRGQTPDSANLRDYQAGDTVYARSYLARVSPHNGRTEAFARTGDRLKVVGMEGGMIKVQRNDGETALYSSAEVRRGKSLPVPRKSMGEIRRQYRTGKGLRRTLRKGTPGSALVYVDNKDLSKVREMAAQKGIKFSHNGQHSSGLEKVKLIGADEAIDEVAKSFGRPIGLHSQRTKAVAKGFDESFVRTALENAEQYGKKLSASERRRLDGIPGGQQVQDLHDKIFGLHAQFDRAGSTGTPQPKLQELLRQYRQAWDEVLRAQGTKHMSQLQRRVKNMDELPPEESQEEIPEEVVGKGLDEESQGGEEPYGAQILRRMHDDASMLMEEYDGMLGPLEHEGVKNHLTGHLQTLEKHLQGTEGLFGKHYSHLGTLGGEKDLEENPEGEDEFLGEGEEEEGDTADKDMDTLDDNGVGADSTDDREEEAPTEEEAFEGSKKSLTDIRKKYTGKKGKKNAPPGVTMEGEEEIPTDSPEEVPAEGQAPLEPQEQEAVKGAHGFLKELSETHEFNDEHRMKAYHYHKTLDPIANPEGGETTPDPMIENGQVGNPGQMSLNGHRRKDMNGTGSCRSTVGEASHFLKSLSQERAFGDPHRQKALHHYKALEPHLSGGEAPPAELPTEQTPQPGEMGEKRVSPKEVKALRKAFLQQSKQMQEITATLNRLASLNK